VFSYLAVEKVQARIEPFDRKVSIPKGKRMNLNIAYFDPTAGSLLLQALVGGFGGIVVAGRFFWMHLLGKNSADSTLTRSKELSVPVINVSR
jgi:hypothetical protein